MNASIMVHGPMSSTELTTPSNCTSSKHFNNRNAGSDHEKYYQNNLTFSINQTGKIDLTMTSSYTNIHVRTSGADVRPKEIILVCLALLLLVFSVGLFFKHWRKNYWDINQLPYYAYLYKVFTYCRILINLFTNIPVLIFILNGFMNRL